MEKANYIPKTWDLPAAIRKRLGATVGRQRLMNEDGHLLLLLHQVPTAEDDEVRTAAVFWRNPDGEWKSSPTPGGLAGLEAHLGAYHSAIHQLDEEVETAKSPREYFGIMRRIHPLQRATRHLSEVLQATRQALPDDTRIISKRDQAVDLARGVDLIAEDAKAGMDFTTAESANQQAQAALVANREARRLNRLVAFFFPLATLVAVFGMNPPEQLVDKPAFWAVLAAGALLGLIVYVGVAMRGSREK